MIFNLRVKGSVLGQFVSNWQAHRHKNATKLWIWPRMKKKQNNRSRGGGIGGGIPREGKVTRQISN